MAINTPHEMERRNDYKSLWAIIALIIVAALAYAAYTSYYTPSENMAMQSEATGTAPAPNTGGTTTDTTR